MRRTAAPLATLTARTAATLATLTALTTALAACGDGDRDPGPLVNGESHWLSACDVDLDCPERYSCLCRVCTAGCDGAGACQGRTEAPSACATLNDQPAAYLCGVSPSPVAGLCLPECDATTPCPATTTCQEGHCVPESIALVCEGASRLFAGACRPPCATSRDCAEAERCVEACDPRGCSRVCLPGASSLRCESAQTGGVCADRGACPSDMALARDDAATWGCDCCLPLDCAQLDDGAACASAQSCRWLPDDCGGAPCETGVCETDGQACVTRFPLRFEAPAEDGAPAAARDVSVTCAVGTASLETCDALVDCLCRGLLAADPTVELDAETCRQQLAQADDGGLQNICRPPGLVGGLLSEVELQLLGVARSHPAFPVPPEAGDVGVCDGTLAYSFELTTYPVGHAHLTLVAPGASIAPEELIGPIADLPLEPVALLEATDVLGYEHGAGTLLVTAEAGARLSAAVGDALSLPRRFVIHDGAEVIARGRVLATLSEANDADPLILALDEAAAAGFTTLRLRRPDGGAWRPSPAYVVGALFARERAWLDMPCPNGCVCSAGLACQSGVCRAVLCDADTVCCSGTCVLGLCR